MSEELTVTAAHDGSVANSDVRGALRGVEYSVTSPVDAYRDFSTSHDEDEVTVHADGDSEFTKKTTDAVKDAIATIDGVVSVETAGGYDAPEEDSGGDESEEDEE